MYPDINDKLFNTKISKKFNDLKIPKKKPTLEQYCFPKKYKLQNPQLFVPLFINPKTPYKSILIYHRIGAGKTCSAIQIAEAWKHKRKIIVVLPASLKGNFRGELRSQCANQEYLTDAERELLKNLSPSSSKYKEIIIKSNERIDKYYNIFSYNKFINKIQQKELKLTKSVLIIDEVQNMVSESGLYYQVLYDFLKTAPDDLRIVLLSATPMFDKPREFALTINLLRPKKEMPTGYAFDKMFIEQTEKNNKITNTAINLDKFKNYIKGYVSYFRGAPAHVFPEMIFKVTYCPMSDFQYGAYLEVQKAEEDLTIERQLSRSNILSINDLPNNFYIGSRMISNVVFPNKKINETGLDSFIGSTIVKNLEKYSPKFAKIMSRISKCHGKVFIYSGFREFGGLKSLCNVLDEFGYKNFYDFGSGKNRYAIWSGDEPLEDKERVKAVFNNIDNITGKKIKILLGSPAIKEGVSLYAIKQVHVVEPYWNQSRLDQIVGRASRFCSHKDFPPDERIVKVYLYIATSPPNKKKIKTVDERIFELSILKEKIIKQFERAIKEAAVDCQLNKFANEDENDPIKCDN